MKVSALILFCLIAKMQLIAQVNPDDELIPSQGGTNDNPVRHRLYTPTSRNRVVFQREGQRGAKETRKRIAALENEKKTALEELKSKMFSGAEGKLADCLDCSGHGIKNCELCGAKGISECPVCQDARDQKCKRCDGAGMVFDQKCTSCEGTGINVCKSCNGISTTCKHCVGAGYFNCATCRGVGKIFVPKSDTLKSNH